MARPATRSSRKGVEWRLPWRILPGGVPPRRVSLEIPGWAGASVRPRDGAVPQPWHCRPFVEGSTYGLELIYPYDTECRVAFGKNGIEFIADFSHEIVPGMIWPPFRMADPDHYSLGTLVDLQAPEGFALRIEPHPRFFSDRTDSVPVPLIANLQTSWWPMFFFVTFKRPNRGREHVFRKGEAYAQVIVVPAKIEYSLPQMSDSEAKARDDEARHLMRNRGSIARRSWTSEGKLSFDDLYKQLLRRSTTRTAETP